MTLVTVCRAAQSTLPCEIREVAHLVEGDYLEAEMTREGILLCPAQIGRNEPSPEVENENNNTLKIKGYHLTHNFGHGKQHFSAPLATFNLLAFLFHTLLQLFDSSSQRLRQFLPRKTFFDDLRALTRYLCFESWEALMAFMIRSLELQTPDTS
jgi:bifunctional DNA-binding transcriptional regulator/antitoxin component of YhaV-PrlF toxin-antitoxin module